MRWRFPPAWPALAVLIAACAGNGEGLDENGRPIGDAPAGPPPAPSDFQAIQDQVFTPICTSCHAGAGAPLGLRLDEGVSYDMLVGVPSVQVPAVLRVEPGDPDASYLVQKIEGTAAGGVRMPIGGPALSAEQIAAVRQWVTDGAQPPAAAAAKSASVAPASVRNGFALADGALVATTRELDASSVHAASVELVRSGGDGVFDDGADIVVSDAHVQRSLFNPVAVVLRLPAAQRSADLYRLRLRGSGGAPLADLRGLPLDGDGDGQPGGDYDLYFKLNFELENAP